MTLKELIQALFTRFHDMIVYGVIGVCTAILNFLIYTILVEWVDMHYMTANYISVICGITASFFLNRKYNFKVGDHTLRRLVVFYAIGLCGLALSSAILYYCIAELSMDKLLGKLVSITLVGFLQFVLHKFVTFRKGRSKG